MPESKPSMRLLTANPVSGSLMRRRWWRWAMMLGLALFLIELLRVTALSNFHRVLGDQVFRSAQLSEAEMGRRLRQHNIQTVINLRGTCVGFDWYTAECRATHDHLVSQEDVTLSSSRLPPPAELRRLIEVLDRCAYPILIHCRRGADRTGLVATLIQLLYSDANLAQARYQHSLRFGHVGFSATGNIDRFFDLYEAWLARLDIQHAPEVFRHWVLNEYCPGAARGHLEVLEPLQWKATEPKALRVRAHNQSIETWQLRPGTRTGVHVRFMLVHEDGQLAYVGHAGQFAAQVPPGESIELVFAVPPLLRPGKYVLNADLIDAEQMAFSQVGSEALMREVIVTD